MPVLPAILPLLIATNGYSYLAAGLLVTAYNVTSSCTQPVVGWLSDTKGFSVSISISLLVSAVFIALMGIAKSLLPDNVLCHHRSTGPCMFSPHSPEPGEPSLHPGKPGAYHLVFRCRGEFWLCNRAGSCRCPCLLAGTPRIIVPHLSGYFHGSCAQVYPPRGNCRSMRISCTTRNPVCKRKSRKNLLLSSWPHPFSGPGRFLPL